MNSARTPKKPTKDGGTPRGRTKPAVPRFAIEPEPDGFDLVPDVVLGVVTKDVPVGTYIADGAGSLVQPIKGVQLLAGDVQRGFAVSGLGQSMSASDFVKQSDTIAISQIAEGLTVEAAKVLLVAGSPGLRRRVSELMGGQD